MSMNCIFGFSLFLLLLVALNIYFFYILSTEHKPSNFKLPIIKSDPTPPVIREINEHLNHLPSQYHNKNSKFILTQKRIVSQFNSTGTVNVETIWNSIENWDSKESLFPNENGAPGKILQALRTAQIVLTDNAPKGTQLKLLLLLEGKQNLYFKPKRYSLNHVVRGNIYAGFDRHNSEVLAYYLAMVLNYKWITPSVIRRVNFNKDILAHATVGLKKTMTKNDKGSMCIYGKCFYCRANETVCPDDKAEIEGAAILYLDKQFKINKSPWRRSYTPVKMEWETDNNFCKKVTSLLSTKRLLNLIDIAIIDFLIQNGDRHRYEVYNDKILLMDNGKGLGNPMVDEMDILAPLYQCCMITQSTWQTLETVSGGSLTETIKLISSFQGEKLATDEHYRAIERRLLKVYATVQYCIAKHGNDLVSETMYKPIKDTFLYFAYGSNLLKRRIRINNPSAEFLGNGRLDGHQLDFIKYSPNWRGTSATIVPTENSHVWGAVWRLNNADMPALDKQEGVDTNWYFAKVVDIVVSDGSTVQCRTYQQTINPPLREKGEELPKDRRPCITYLDCIINGAIECNLPEYYISELKLIPNNGEIASPEMIEKLNKAF